MSRQFTVINLAALFISICISDGVVPLDYVSSACSVYCDGTILRSIQLAQIFNDSKTFVDMPMRYDPIDILRNFSMLQGNDFLSLSSFIDENFLPAGSDILPWIPEDFQRNPMFLSFIDDPDSKLWACELNNLWLLLGKIVSSDVVVNPQRHSLLPRPFPMIVPGGRFRESYYWDTYWILRGLLVSGMTHTSWGIISNLITDVENFGFVPNGGRIYYLDRSQPPLLNEMVCAYVESVGWASVDGVQKIQVALPALLREYAWWMNPLHGHVVVVNGFTLNVYHSNSSLPRPESYREDYDACLNNTGSRNISVCYNEIRSGAETGWDFSSRWIQGGQSDLSKIATSSVIPVDLNSILYKIELNLAKLISANVAEDRLTRKLSADVYKEAAQARFEAMDALLWDESCSCWRDYSISSGTFTSSVSPANWMPLWAGILTNAKDHIRMSQKANRAQVDETTMPTMTAMTTSVYSTSNMQSKRMLSQPSLDTHTDSTHSYDAEAVVASLESSGLLQAGGLLTTTAATGLQWDAPNSWPPLVLLTIEGLQLQVEVARAQELAVSI